MNRQTIEKAALELCTTEGQEEWLKDYGKNCFMGGARWRIDSVWNTDVKAGNTRRAILVRFNNGLFNVFGDIRDLKGIEDLVAMFAYLDDLIPNGREVQP